jgi:MFS family permease
MLYPPPLKQDWAEPLMDNELTTAEKISRLPWSIASNATNTVFIQLTYFGSVFVLFLGALGFATTQIGFVLSLIPFSNVVALFIATIVARFGLKRTYVASLVLRSTVTLGLLLTPWVLASTQDQTTLLIFIMSVVAAFAICRAFMMTAYYPWVQEYVPPTVQGKYSATNNIFTALTGFVTVTLAGLVLEQFTGLTGYMFLFAAGVLFGYISAWAATYIPGGLPAKAGEVAGIAFRSFVEACRDRGFIRYMFGLGFVTLATVSLTSFTPLYLQEQVGLSTGNVVFIQTSILLGGLLSTYLWGWTADRYGSRPIMLSGAGIRTVLPVFWILIPRNDASSLYIAMGIALLQGIADMGWVIGSMRQLYVSVVPVEKRTVYMAFYTAWAGIVAGFGQLMGGKVIQVSANVSGQFLIFVLDPYTALFVLGIILPVLGILLLRTVRTDTKMSMEEFAGLFLRGNPLMAMTLLAEYRLARDEHAVVHITERLGQTRSPLTVEELLEALVDPRFNVRFEAIISIARTRQDPRLTEALIAILNGTEVALSVQAAWALGRIGDPAATEALRQSLESRYHSIQVHSIRALGTMGDQQSAPIFLERLADESDKGLQMACASALGKLQFGPATGPILQLLKTTSNEGARLELALSLARLVGDESHFTHLVRGLRSDLATATAQAVSALKKKMRKEQLDQPELRVVMDDSADALARGHIEQGVALVVRIIQLLPADDFDETGWTILQDCSVSLTEYRSDRLEYLLLALHVMETGWH